MKIPVCFDHVDPTLVNRFLSASKRSVERARAPANPPISYSVFQYSGNFQFGYSSFTPDFSHPLPTSPIVFSFPYTLGPIFTLFHRVRACRPKVAEGNGSPFPSVRRVVLGWRLILSCLYQFPPANLGGAGRGISSRVAQYTTSTADTNIIAETKRSTNFFLIVTLPLSFIIPLSCNFCAKHYMRFIP